MSALWSSAALADAVGGQLVGAVSPHVCGIAIDSRTINAGDAFFAIMGDRFDGHAFVPQALARGAGVCVVSAAKLPDLPPEGAYLVVDDVLQALQEAGRAARARAQGQICAITGSVGKTGTKEALKAALEPSGSVHASVASFNNHWGVPLTLARLPMETQFGIFEVGMNHAGEIRALTQMVRPQAALITTIEPVHIEHFASLEAIAEAKAEIFEGMDAGAVAVLNRDNALYDFLASRALARGLRVVSFGAHESADVRLLNASVQPLFSAVSARILGVEAAYKVGIPGRHIVQNSLGVMAMVAVLGGDLALAGLALARLTPPTGRGTRDLLALPKGGAFTLIDESYNANPASMRAALGLLGSAPLEAGGRRIAVLGDMLELGEMGVQAHGELAQIVEQAGIDLVYASGALMAHLWAQLPESRRGAYAPTAAALETIVHDAARPHDLVMVKGSHGSRMGAIVDGFRARFALIPAHQEG